MIAYLLHHANRVAKNYAYTAQFYLIKDSILKRGVVDGYDIQHIRGKRCRSCHGTGWHEKYSMYPPYKVYDTDGCWHCNATGFYKLPMWICLQRVRLGPYLFHQPLKREMMVKNPWTENKMGWCVSERPVISGYIEHTSSWLGVYALLILFRMYDRESYRKLKRVHLHNVRCRFIWKLRRWKKLFTWDNIVIEKPEPFIKHYQYADGYKPIDQLPF